MSLKSLRRWWQIRTGRFDTPFDGGAPFWFVSLSFHVLLLVLLAKLMMPSQESREVSLTMDSEKIEIFELTPEIDLLEELNEEFGSEEDLSFELAPDESPVIEMEVETPVEVDTPSNEVGELLTDDREFFEATARELSQNASKGSVGHSASGASGAVDRITQEILLSLDDNETMVVWLFDRSASLLEQRDEIVGRFDRIYEELGLLRESGNKSFDNHDDQPLLTQIYGYGLGVERMLKEPTEDLSEIKAAINKIDRDDSGVENTMTAIMEAAAEYKQMHKVNRTTGKYQRNVMLIVVTDEAGDDNVRLDDTVKLLNKYQMPVIVVGVPAPFGRPVTRVKWVDPDPEFDQTPQWAEVSQGPESLMPERLRMDFSGTFEDLDMIDSGFGPFALTRLAFETNGLYIAVHPNRRTDRSVRMGETAKYASHLNYFFDSEVMRKYRPDYVSRASYLSRLQKSKTRSSLVQAATYTTTGTLASPRLRFPKFDEAQFVRSVSQAQRAAAVLEPKIERLYQIIKVGEADRSKETSIRWQAGFDLAMGRVLANKIRAESYNGMLALAKTKLKFENENSNTWVLRPADAISTGSQAEKLADKARMYLERVVDEHPGTPWAMLAARELETPIGWEWTESFTEPPRPRDPNANNNNNPNNPRPMENQMPKRVRKPPKL